LSAILFRFSPSYNSRRRLHRTSRFDSEWRAVWTCRALQQHGSDRSFIRRSRTEKIRSITRSCRRGAMHQSKLIFTERFIMGGDIRKADYDTHSPWRFSWRPRILSSSKRVATWLFAIFCLRQKSNISINGHKRFMTGSRLQSRFSCHMRCVHS